MYGNTNQTPAGNKHHNLNDMMMEIADFLQVASVMSALPDSILRLLYTQLSITFVPIINLRH
ncbi:protein of unknown function [Xenorhabdus poinarii G6]|uniref:Uncharacterized protein n=1 Tax=Xenorhabdus poinarii G6 TaxID=1354304 RepID=A0A068R4I5_9GAMM|nr:hypothetical protein [Xenorhabdus poinarii]CDG21949.1 protein of unknown function [Xenorhabdus poinarii G6]